IRQYWRTVTTAFALTRAMLCPECIDDFWSLIAVVLPFLIRYGEDVEARRKFSLRAAGVMKPFSLFPVRSITGIIGNDLRPYFSFIVAEQSFYFLAVQLGHLVFRNFLAPRVPPEPDYVSPLIGYFKKFWTNPRR